MKSRFALRALTSLFLVVSLSAFAGVRDDITRSFDVGPGGTLSLEAEFGDVDIRTGGSKVDVKIFREVRTDNQARANDLFAQHRVTFNASGDRVEIVAETPNKWNWSNKLKVRYEITVPERFDVDLSTSGGDITVADLRGDLEAATSGGDLVLGNVDGLVRIRTSGGDVDLEDVSGDVEAKTSGGDVSIGRVGGRVEAKTSGGDIEVRGSAADLEVSTSGGDVDLFEIEGSVRASTSGGSISAYLMKTPGQSCRLGTSGGSITLYLGPGVGLEIDASTSGGRIHADVPITVTEMDGRSEISGSVNGGGPRMTLRTSSGSIRIKNAE